MDRVIALLDQAKKACKATTDMELASCLHVKRATLSKWRTGNGFPDEVSCARIAELTGEPLARVLGVVGEARAKSGAAKAVWRRLASAAAVILSAWIYAPQSTAEGLSATAHNVYTRLRRFIRTRRYCPAHAGA